MFSLSDLLITDFIKDAPWKHKKIMLQANNIGEMGCRWPVNKKKDKPSKKSQMHSSLLNFE